MSRSVFDEIREVYTRWEDVRTDRYHQCLRLAGRIPEGFRAFIGAPEWFEAFDSSLDSRRKERYVKLAKVSPLDVNDLYHFDDSDSLHDVLQHDEDEGTLVFGVKLTIDRETNTFPKQNIWFRISIRFENNECRIRLYNKNPLVLKDKELDTTTNGAFEPLFVQMAEFVKDAFGRDPWELPRSATPIGFTR